MKWKPGVKEDLPDIIRALKEMRIGYPVNGNPLYLFYENNVVCAGSMIQVINSLFPLSLDSPWGVRSFDASMDIDMLGIRLQ